MRCRLQLVCDYIDFLVASYWSALHVEKFENFLSHIYSQAPLPHIYVGGEPGNEVGNVLLPYSVVTPRYRANNICS